MLVNQSKISLHDGELVLHQRDGVKGIWHYRVRLPDGTYERKTTGETNYEKAKKVGEDRWLEVRWRDERGYSAKDATFAKAAAAYIASLHRQATLDGNPLPQKDKKKIDRLEKFLIPYFGTTVLKSIDAKAITNFHDNHLERWKLAKEEPTTVSRRIKQADGSTRLMKVTRPNTMIKRPGPNGRAFFDWLIRIVLDHAVSQGSITRAEIHEFDLTKADKRKRGGFTQAEQKQLLDYLEGQLAARAKHHRAQRRMLWLWVRLNLLCGTRPGDESNTLRFKDFEPVDGAVPHYVVNVRQGKTGPRKVVADMALSDIINALKADHPDPEADAVIWQNSHMTGAYSCHEAFWRVLRKLGLDRDDAGRERTSYSLRHTAITNAIRRNVNLSLIAKNCGTSVSMISKHYDHDNHVDRAADLLK
jgi:hypothetical protein